MIPRFDCSNIGPNTVTLTVKDINGNIATGTAIVTIVDKTLPIVITKNITAQIDAGGIAVIADRAVDNGSYDPCGLVLYQLNKTRFDCSNIGPNTVTLTVKDINGKIATGTAIVTVEDKTLPIVITKDITVLLGTNGSVTVNARDVDNGSYDACGLISYVLDKTTFTCYNIGGNVVTLTVTDANGNKASATATVIVKGTGVRNWVLDNDLDGYYNGASIAGCTSPGVGYVVLTNQITGDCNDNNRTVWVNQTYYLDFDKDGYGNAAKPLSICSSVPPAGYVTNRADCNDSNPAISPAAVEVCGNKIDDNCNGLIDEVPCSPCRNATNFTTTFITNTSARFNWNAIANPVQWQIQYKSTKPGTKWVDIFLTGNLRNYSLTGLLANTNYQWQIRARCGNTWTAYSPSATFKTSSSLVARSSIKTIIEVPVTELRVYPNPTNGQFNLELQQPDQSAGIAVVTVRDISGRIVKTEKLSMLKGSLKAIIRMPGSAIAGMYLVNVIVGDQAYNTKVVLIK